MGIQPEAVTGPWSFLSIQREPLEWSGQAGDARRVRAWGLTAGSIDPVIQGTNTPFLGESEETVKPVNEVKTDSGVSDVHVHSSACQGGSRAQLSAPGEEGLGGRATLRRAL